MSSPNRDALIAECDDVIVNTYGLDGNTLVIVGAVRREMSRAGVSKAAIETYSKEALSGDYENVLKTTAAWVTLVHITPESRAQTAIGAFRQAGLSPEIES